MIEPVAVYLDPIDHDAIERQLDEQMGLKPRPKRERSWDCLAGEASVVCSHVRIARLPVGNGLTRVTCECGSTWNEVA